MTWRKIEEVIAEHEEVIARYRFLREKLPDIQINRTSWRVIYSSKSVNSSYTNFRPVTGHSCIYMEPYLEIGYPLPNGEEQIIPVYGSPRKIKLAYLAYPKDPITKGFNYKAKRVIKFCRLRHNLKQHQIKDECFHECRAAIIKFIQKYPTLAMDDKWLDPSLKKLLAFT